LTADGSILLTACEKKSIINVKVDAIRGEHEKRQTGFCCDYTMLPDIDSTVLPFTMLLFIYASLVALAGCFLSVSQSIPAIANAYDLVAKGILSRNLSRSYCAVPVILSEFVDIEVEIVAIP
jgi:hypothetical protein